MHGYELSNTPSIVGIIISIQVFQRTMYPYWCGDCYVMTIPHQDMYTKLEQHSEESCTYHTRGQLAHTKKVGSQHQGVPTNEFLVSARVSGTRPIIPVSNLCG